MIQSEIQTQRKERYKARSGRNARREAMNKIGCHVSMKAPDSFAGAVKEALSYKANALMIYTGPPQNTLRKPVEQLRIEEAQSLLKENGIPLENVIVHAPYIINLGNVQNPDTFELGVRFLKQELARTAAIGARYLVLPSRFQRQGDGGRRAGANH